ncbi:MAG: Clp protease N-terminal domain-containing protein [Actinomycetota bacterium]
MFERFTREARGVVMQAVERAQVTQSPNVDTSHILLGVAGGAGAAARVLAEAGATAERIAGALDRTDEARLLGVLGIDVGEVRASVERTFGPGAWTGPGRARGPRGSLRTGHIPFTADARKALELSLREALALECRSIEAGHILLGLLRVGGRPVEALAALGVDTAAVRDSLVAVLRRAS